MKKYSLLRDNPLWDHPWTSIRWYGFILEIVALVMAFSFVVITGISYWWLIFFFFFELVCYFAGIFNHKYLDDLDDKQEITPSADSDTIV